MLLLCRTNHPCTSGFLTQLLLVKNTLLPQLQLFFALLTAAAAAAMLFCHTEESCNSLFLFLLLLLGRIWQRKGP